MIVYPVSWEKVGARVSLNDLEEALLSALMKIQCNHISFSGGLDSSLLLYYLTQIFKEVHAYTIGSAKYHPDVIFAEKFIANDFPYVKHHVFIPAPGVIKPGKTGAPFITWFYSQVAHHTDRIITGDGIDEYMAGYYTHVESPTEEHYFDLISRLHVDHLRPLNNTSGDVKVYLPYLSSSLINLYNRIPLSQKICGRERKVIMQAWASGKLPDDIIYRRKYGFCDAMTIKENKL